MALIGKIRNNSWLLIIFIGLGLALFIITSMFVGNEIPFLGSRDSTGSINGEEVKWDDFADIEEAFRGSNDIYSTRNYIWNFLVEDAIVKKEADALGFVISDDEKEELFFGPNPHPKIRQFFTDPTTGQFDANQQQQAKQVLESGEEVNPRFLSSWNQQTKEVIKDKLQSRINTLVSKSVFTPTWMVEQAHVDQTQTAKFQFVKIPFDEIDNSEVTVEDADLKAYLAENKALYYQDEQARKVDYVVFDVIPTADDTTFLKGEMSKVKEELLDVTKNDTITLEVHQGASDPRLLSRADIGPNSILTEGIADAVFNAEPGEVVGPIVEGNQIKIAKLLDKRVLPDSATSRHILLSATTPAEFAAVQVRIDSFKNVIESGAAPFDSLAVRFSQDPGSASKGGLYENVAVNAFVPEYNDIIFFKGEIGKLYSVKSSYGIHLIEPISRKYADNSDRTERVRVSVVSKTIVPTDGTQEAVRVLAQDFMANNRSLNDFSKSAQDKGYIVETSAPLKANDFTIGDILGSGATSRDIVKWAFKAEDGSVAPLVYEYQDPVEYYSSKFVVAGLKSVIEAGNPSFQDIKEEIEPIVINRKKADIIKNRISSQDLSAIASTFASQVDTVASVNFNSSFVANLGSEPEPEVVATAFNLAPNSVSAPITGNSGVFVVKLENKTEAGSPTNIPLLRQQTSRSTQSQIAGSLIQSMKKAADIKDLRSKFY